LHVLALQDGIGAVKHASSLKAAFKHGISLTQSTPLAEQFVKKIMPRALEHAVRPSFIFARAWDAFVGSLRRNDMISNEEQCLLMYGDGVVGVDPKLPLMMYAGKILRVIQRSPTWMAHIRPGMNDEDVVDLICQRDSLTADALQEILSGLPLLIAQVCQSHSSIGFHDPHILARMTALLQPPPGQKLSDFLITIRRNVRRVDLCLVELAGLVSRMCIEIERQNASTRLLGNALVDATVRLLQLLQQVLGTEENHESYSIDRCISSMGAQPWDGQGERIASMQELPDMPPTDTRSLEGIIQLLQTPNEATGMLDGDVQNRSGPGSVRLETLSEIARRTHYLLTMESTHAILKVPEAERRVKFFIQSLYMHQMPISQSVLDMQSFNAVTPVYGEAVIYEKNEYLCKADEATGIIPMLYLTTMYKQEWINFLERTGCKDDQQAWTATVDARNHPMNGELEVRFWASKRGQTLSRAIFGVMEYAEAVQLLSKMELELEYAAIEAEKPPEQQLSAEKISSDALKAAKWFTAQRVAYVCACQRYSENGPDEMRKRVQVDILLVHHPLLRVVYFDSTVGEDGKKRLRSVCKEGTTIRYNIPMPGHPIADGIGEGKPENQNNSQPFQFARIIQVRCWLDLALAALIPLITMQAHCRLWT
jgi:hypothetical protein